MEELIKRAEQGDAEAQLELAKSYHSGEGLEENQELALYWLKKAYEGGKEAAFDVIKEISKANRETPASIDMDTLSGLIVKLEKLKEFYNQSGDLEKVKLASNLVQELTEGTNRDAWIPFAQSWVELYESRS